VVEDRRAAPNASAADSQKLHRATEQAERLSDSLSHAWPATGHSPALFGCALPMDEVRENTRNRSSSLAALKRGMKPSHHLLTPGDDLMGAIRPGLRPSRRRRPARCRLPTMPIGAGANDRHCSALFWSERLSPFDQVARSPWRRR